MTWATISRSDAETIMHAFERCRETRNCTAVELDDIHVYFEYGPYERMDGEGVSVEVWKGHGWMISGPCESVTLETMENGTCLLFSGSIGVFDGIMVE